MTFERVGSDEAAVTASGHISDKTPAAFAAFLRQRSGNRQSLTVYLDSSGGTVTGAMQLGTLMRQAGATAIVGKASAGIFGGRSVDDGECYSACVYALMGARRRVVPPNSQVGIHRMFIAVEGQGGDVSAFVSARERAAASGIRASLVRYTSRMGVSPDLVAFAERTPSSEFHVLTQAEIRQWRLATP